MLPTRVIGYLRRRKMKSELVAFCNFWSDFRLEWRWGFCITHFNSWKWDYGICKAPEVHYLVSNPELWHSLCVASFANCCCLVTKLCLSFCDPVDCSSPCSSVHGISQARILEWVAMPSSRGSSRPRDRTHVSDIGRQTLYHWATREAISSLSCPTIPLSKVRMVT